MRTIKVCIALALISLAACGGSGSSGPPSQQGGTNTPPPAGGISVLNNSFSPSSKSVTAGTTVQWAWNSCSGGDSYGSGQICVAHNVVFDDGATSGLQDQGVYNRTFASAGTYPYHCSVHGAAAMSGSVTVTP
jgi:plastocyanin